MNKKKGFTLIELLVVIAIIGILSSIILIAVHTAQNKAKNARIISDMSQIRSMAEVLRSGNNYNDLNCTAVGATCTCSNSSVKQLCEDIYVQNANAGLSFEVGDKYCVQVNLIGGGAFCIDSSGYAGKTNVSCDSTHYTCAND